MKRLLIAFFLLLIPSAHAVDYLKCDAINRLEEKVEKEMSAGSKRLAKTYKYQIEEARWKIAKPYCEDLFGSTTKKFNSSYLSCMGYLSTYDMEYLDYVNLDNLNPKFYEQVESIRNSLWETFQTDLKRHLDRYRKKLLGLANDYLEEGCP